MSTFYVLPPRPQLGRRFADFLQAILPGPEWRDANPAVLAETLGTALMQIPDVYVLHREDLPDGEASPQSLVDGFGAAEGDEVIEIKTGTATGEMVARRWRLTMVA